MHVHSTFYFRSHIWFWVCVWIHCFVWDLLPHSAHYVSTFCFLPYSLMMAISVAQNHVAVDILYIRCCVDGLFVVFLLTADTMGMNHPKIHHHFDSPYIQLSLSGVSGVKKPLWLHHLWLIFLNMCSLYWAGSRPNFLCKFFSCFVSTRTGNDAHGSVLHFLNYLWKYEYDLFSL